jgi:hypothetical protein
LEKEIINDILAPIATTIGWWGNLEALRAAERGKSFDFVETDKKTVQAQWNEGWGFLADGNYPAELPVINLQACLTAFL